MEELKFIGKPTLIHVNEIGLDFSQMETEVSLETEENIEIKASNLVPTEILNNEGLDTKFVVTIDNVATEQNTKKDENTFKLESINLDKFGQISIGFINKTYKRNKISKNLAGTTITKYVNLDKLYKNEKFIKFFKINNLYNIKIDVYSNN
jgi:hypothetical protein